MKTLINDFCGGCPVEIKTYVHPEPSIGAGVSITQYHGALSFNHSMLPTQARAMAAALIACADELEPIIAELVAA